MLYQNQEQSQLLVVNFGYNNNLNSFNYKWLSFMEHTLNCTVVNSIFNKIFNKALNETFVAIFISYNQI